MLTVSEKEGGNQTGQDWRENTLEDTDLLRKPEGLAERGLQAVGLSGTQSLTGEALVELVQPH